MKHISARYTFTYLLAVAAVNARRMTKREVKERQLEATTRWQTSWMSGPGLGEFEDAKHNGVQNITFTNPKASGERMATSEYSL